MKQARSFIDEWLQTRQDQGLSAYTLKLEASALAKLYGCATTDFIKTKARQSQCKVCRRYSKIQSLGYKDQDFIFCGKDGRTTRREIQYTIEKVCKKADMPVKTAHDIRRTVASTFSTFQKPKIAQPLENIGIKRKYKKRETEIEFLASRQHFRK